MENKKTNSKKDYKVLTYILIALLSLAIIITGISYYNAIRNNNSNRSYSSLTSKIFFSANGGTGWDIKSAIVKNGYNMPTLISENPTRKGYTFMGWYDNPNYLNGKQYYNELGVSTKTYDRRGNVVLYAGWKANQLLFGKALTEFKKANNLNMDFDIIVEKNTVDVNGVHFNIYFVYNINISDEDNNNYITYVNRTIENIRNIDTKVLMYLYKNGTDLIFLGTDDCDNSCIQNGHCTFAAYTNSLTRDIVVAYSYSYLSSPRYQRSAMHELGHAFDFTLRYDITGDTKAGITGLKSEQILKGYTNQNGKFIASSALTPLFIGNKYSKLNVYTWKDLAGKYAVLLKNNLEDFTVYSDQDLAKSGLEFFAEVFRYYFWDAEHQSNLKDLSPDTCAALEKVISYVN